MEELLRKTPNDGELGKKIRHIITKGESIEVKGLKITFEGTLLTNRELSTYVNFKKSK